MIYPERPEGPFIVYILRCGDRSLFTGLTNDLFRRYEAHLKRTDRECPTYRRHPLQLVYYESHATLQEAEDRAALISSWSPRRTQFLIDEHQHRNLQRPSVLNR